MKALLLGILSLGFIQLTLAQSSLSLSYEGGAIQPNDTVIFYGDSGVNTTITAYLFVSNNTNTDLAVKVKKTEISIVPGTENTFCWGQCYIPSVYVSPQAITIPAQTTDNHSFWGEYHPQGQLGTSILRYTFFVDNDSNDSVAVYVKYTATPTGVSENELSLALIYPNPASEFIYIKNFKQDNSHIIFKEMTGKIICEISLSSFPLDVRNWSAGVYFYQIVDENMSLPKKLVIAK
jgi:hypothetical protein